MKKFSIYTKLKEKGYSGKKNVGDLLDWLLKKDVRADFQWSNEDNIICVQVGLIFHSKFDTTFYGEGYSNYSDALESAIISCYDYI